MGIERLIIHDLPEGVLEGLTKLSDGDVVINARARAASCIGCFGCWQKTPGACVLKDGFQYTGAAAAQSREVVIISAARYGEYSTEVKRIIDRSISANLPFFTYRDGRIHHTLRYKNSPALTVYFYGELTDFEKSVAEDRVCFHAKNLGAHSPTAIFAESAESLREVWR